MPISFHFSNRCQRSLDYPTRLSGLYFLHLCRRFKGRSIHWLHTVSDKLQLMCSWFQIDWKSSIIRLLMMFGAIFLVMIKGTLDIGGLGVVWEKAVESNRIEYPEWVSPALNELTAFFQFVWFHSIRLAFDLRTRHTIYAVVIGGFAQWLKSNAISQNMIQRYLALPTLRDAKLWEHFYLALFLYFQTIYYTECFHLNQSTVAIYSWNDDSYHIVFVLWTFDLRYISWLWSNYNKTCQSKRSTVASVGDANFWWLPWTSWFIC